MEVTVQQSRDYLDNMISVFQYLINSADFRKHSPESAAILGNHLARLRSIKRIGQDNWFFEISPNIELELTDKKFCGPIGETHLVIGMSMRVVDGLLEEQSIAICLVSSSDDELEEELSERYCCGSLGPAHRTVVRRFHFDFDRGQIGQDRPPSHMQYGGKFDPGHLEGNLDYKYELFKAIDLPRLPSPPYDFPILFDMLLQQFGIKSAEITKENAWRNIVRKSEDIWLKPYFRRVHDLLNSADRHSSFYEHLCEPVLSV